MEGLYRVYIRNNKGLGFRVQGFGFRVNKDSGIIG